MMSLREAAEDEREGEVLPKEEEKIFKVSAGGEEKVEGALQLIILAISIGQGSGQGERQEDEEEEIWMDLVLVGSIVMVLLYGLWKLVGGVLRMILKRNHKEKIEKEKSEESEEEQKKEEQDAEDRRLEGRVKKALMKSQQQRDQVRERMMRSSNDQEASASASEDRSDIQVPTALSSTWSLEDQRLRGRGPAFITVYGKKWHALTTCPRVSNVTGPLKPSAWCTLCSAEPREHHEVYGKGRREVVHYRSDCPRLVVGSNQYSQCLVCRDMIQRR